ncbi:TPA: hypothetical protein ACOFCN_002020 [Stenotrophomonas maltophilia]
MAGDRHRIPEHKRPKHKGRGKGHSFVQLPHYMIQSPQFYALSGTAVKVLLFLAGQYNGKNNGDLSATESMVSAAGVCSARGVGAVLTSLEEAGFIVKTRTGHRRLCNLYALTWYRIDECEGKGLEVAPEHAPSNVWKTKSVPQNLPFCTATTAVKAA